jgi:hypothetical protein
MTPKEWRARYSQDPVKFCKEVLGVKTHPKFEDILNSICFNHDTAVKGCYKSSKTFCAACAVHWWLCTDTDRIAITTAPTENQVKNLLWRDIKDIAENAKVDLYCGIPITGQEINLGAKWFARGFTANEYNEESFQGFHCKNGVLFIIDEGNGVAPVFFDARHKIAQDSQDRFLTIGNPVYPDTEFYRCHINAGFNSITISASDTPNIQAGELVIKGMLEKETVERWREEWGEESMFYRTRVLAEFWDKGTSGLIPLSWYEAAVERGKRMLAGEIEYAGDKVVSADVSEGLDESIKARVNGRLVDPFECYTDYDTTRFGYHIERDINRGYKAVVDAIGIGSGVVSTIRNDGYECIAYKGSEVSWRKDKSGEIGFNNLRSYSYWLIREAMNPANPDAIGLSEDDPKLREDLTFPTYSEVSGGKIALEKKELLVKRLGRSPDRGDALAMAIYAKTSGGAVARITGNHTQGSNLLKSIFD